MDEDGVHGVEQASKQASQSHWCGKVGNMTSRGEKRDVLRLRLKEPIDDDSLIFCGIEFQTVGAENLKALRLTALVVRGTCKRSSE